MLDFSYSDIIKKIPLTKPRIYLDICRDPILEHCIELQKYHRKADFLIQLTAPLKEVDDDLERNDILYSLPPVPKLPDLADEESIKKRRKMNTLDLIELPEEAIKSLLSKAIARVLYVQGYSDVPSSLLQHLSDMVGSYLKSLISVMKSIAPLDESISIEKLEKALWQKGTNGIQELHTYYLERIVNFHNRLHNKCKELCNVLESNLKELDVSRETKFRKSMEITETCIIASVQKEERKLLNTSKSSNTSISSLNTVTIKSLDNPLVSVNSEEQMADNEDCNLESGASAIDLFLRQEIKNKSQSAVMKLSRKEAFKSNITDSDHSVDGVCGESYKTKDQCSIEIQEEINPKSKIDIVEDVESSGHDSSVLRSFKEELKDKALENNNSMEANWPVNFESDSCTPSNDNKLPRQSIKEIINVNDVIPNYNHPPHKSSNEINESHVVSPINELPSLSKKKHKLKKQRNVSKTSGNGAKTSQSNGTLTSSIKKLTANFKGDLIQQQNKKCKLDSKKLTQIKQQSSSVLSKVFLHDSSILKSVKEELSEDRTLENNDNIKANCPENNPYNPQSIKELINENDVNLNYNQQPQKSSDNINNESHVNSDISELPGLAKKQLNLKKQRNVSETETNTNGTKSPSQSNKTLKRFTKKRTAIFKDDLLQQPNKKRKLGAKKPTQVKKQSLADESESNSRGKLRSREKEVSKEN